MSDDKNTKTPRDTHYAKLRRAYRDQKAGGHPGGASLAHHPASGHAPR